MFKVGAIVAELELRKRKWDQSLKAVKKDTSSFRGAVLRNSTAIKKMGRNMTVAGAAIVGSLGLMVKASVKFNREMSNVATLIADTAQTRIPELKRNVQDLAMATGKSTSDIAGGLYQVISAFQDSADTADLLGISVKAAAAGMAQTTDAVGLLSAVTKAYGDTSVQAVTKVADLAFMTVKLGQTTFPELASSIGMVTPQMEALGVAQEELFAGFATLTGVTGDAAMVATQLKGVINAVASATPEMADAMKTIGYESAETMIKQEGLVGAMRMLIGTTDGSVESIKKLFPNIRALPAVFALAGGQAKTFDEKLKAMSDTAGAMDEAFKQISSGINESGFNMERLKQTVVVLAQRLGDKLAPILGRLAVSIAKVVHKVSDWIEKNPKLTSFVLKVAGGIGVLMTVLGPLLMILPGIVAAVGAFKLSMLAVIGPIGLAIGVLGALAVGYLKVKDAQEAARKADERYQENVVKLKNKLNEARKAINMNGREWGKLTTKYKGNYAAMAMAIYKGKEGVELQKALAKESKKSKESIKAQTEAIKDQAKEIKNLNKPIAKWKEFLTTLSIKTIPQKKKRAEELTLIIKELKVQYDAGIISLKNYQAATKSAKDELRGYSEELVDTVLPKQREFGDVLQKAPAWLANVGDSTAVAKQHLREFAAQMGMTSAEVQIGGYNMMATFMNMSGIGLPKITLASEATTKAVKTQWDDMADGIKTSWINNLSEVLKGSKSLKDGLAGVWGTVKDQFFDVISKMVAKWTLSFVTSILSGGKGLLSGVTGIFKGIGNAFSGLFGKGGSAQAAVTGEGGLVGNFLGGIGKMAGPIGIGLLAAKLIGFKNIQKTVQDVWKAVSANVISSIKAIGKVSDAVLGAVADVVTGIGKGIGGILAGIGGIAGGLGGIFGGGDKKQIQQGRDMIWWLEHINTILQENILSELYKIKDERLGQMFPKFDAMLAQFYQIRTATKSSATSLSGLKEGIKISGSILDQGFSAIDTNLSGINQNTYGILNALTSQGTVFVDVFKSKVFESVGEKITGNVVNLKEGMEENLKNLIAKTEAQTENLKMELMMLDQTAKKELYELKKAAETATGEQKVALLKKMEEVQNKAQEKRNQLIHQIQTLESAQAKNLANLGSDITFSIGRMEDSVGGAIGHMSKNVSGAIGGIRFDEGGIIDAIKNIPGARGVPTAQKGITLTEPGLVMTHGTPSRPEIVLPPEGAAHAMKPSVIFDVTIAPVFEVTTPDEGGTRRFIREKGLPETISALENNVDEQLTRLKRVLGI